MNEVVKIFDTTLRDGEQCPGASMNTEQKIKVAQALDSLGVDIMEAGFPIASKDDFNAVKEISSVVKKASVCGLARAVEKDIKTCFNAIEKAKKPRIHTFLATSNLHLEYKLKITKDEALKKAVEMVRFARSLCRDIEFSPEDASRSDLGFLYEILSAVIEVGASTLNIPDTVGYCLPTEFGDFIKKIKENTKGIEKAVISVHCHNDLGLATANALSAVKNGARQVECTVNGIGERAGNSALEEVVMNIKTRKDYFKGLKTNISTKEIHHTSKLVSSMTGFHVQRNKAIVGANAFAHESGIHQDGILKHRETYEIMKAEDIGLNKNKLVLGKHSGRHALKDRLNSLGIELNEEELKKTFERFKDLADKKKEVFDEDLEAIVNDEISLQNKRFSLENLQVVCGTSIIPTATVKIKEKDKESLEISEIGTGPVDAIYKAIDKCTGAKNKLVEFSLNAVTEGIDALAEVVVKIESKDGKSFIGKGAHTDIVVASAKAYLSAINKV